MSKLTLHTSRETYFEILNHVMPAEAGIHKQFSSGFPLPAFAGTGFAGMTVALIWTAVYSYAKKIYRTIHPERSAG